MRIHEFATIFTFAAGGDAGNQNPVTLFESANTRADRLYNTNTLMSQNAPGLTGCNITFEDMQISAANGGFGDSDDSI